jgi:hypothetical protein
MGIKTGAETLQLTANIWLALPRPRDKTWDMAKASVAGAR